MWVGMGVPTTQPRWMVIYILFNFRISFIRFGECYYFDIVVDPWSPVHLMETLGLYILYAEKRLYLAFKNGGVECFIHIVMQPSSYTSRVIFWPWLNSSFTQKDLNAFYIHFQSILLLKFFSFGDVFDKRCFDGWRFDIEPLMYTLCIKSHNI